MEVAYLPVRWAGMEFTYMVDDLLGRGGSLLRCMNLARLPFWALAALGFFFTKRKCMVYPTQRGKSLGFIVDTLKQMFEVSQDKIDRIETLFAQVKSAAWVTNKHLQKLARQMMALKPAFPIASLFARPLYLALTGHEWNHIPTRFATPVQYLTLFGDWLKALHTVGGAKWNKPVRPDADKS